MPKEKKDLNSTTEVPVSERLIDQIVGQERSVELIRKAAAQKRNVLLVGLPGTGKSMLAQAMAEILPLSQLQDILVYPNHSDQNNPRIRPVKAGEGKKIVHKARIDAHKEEDNMRLLGFLLPVGWFLLAWVFWILKWYSDIVFAAFIILGGFLMIGFALGSQMKTRKSKKSPKLLIDNAGKKMAPFIEATGARAGSLLGDVRHDPLQSFSPVNKLMIKLGESLEEISFEDLWKHVEEKYPDLVETHENNYQAIVFPHNENIYSFGLKNNQVVLSRIYSMNRRPYNGEVINISVGESKLTLTPEHQVVTGKGDKKAEQLSEKDSLLRLIDSEIAQQLVSR